MHQLMSKCRIGEVEFLAPTHLKELKVDSRSDTHYMPMTEGECVFHSRGNHPFMAKSWIKPLNTTGKELAKLLKASNDEAYFIVGRVV